MTIEEAIAILIRETDEDPFLRTEYRAQIHEALYMAINALKQTDVLDKIRAEIETHCGLLKENHCKYCPNCYSVMGVREILEVIDKNKK